MGELGLLLDQLIDEWGAYKESLDLENKRREEEAFKENERQVQQYKERKEAFEQLEQKLLLLYQQAFQEYEALPRYKKVATKPPERIILHTPYDVLFAPSLLFPPLVYPTWTGFLDWLSVQRKKYQLDEEERK